MKKLEKNLLFEALGPFFKEDGITDFSYVRNLPEDVVDCKLKFKSRTLICGLDVFFGVFDFLGQTPTNVDEIVNQFEGKFVEKLEIPFQLPMSLALTGERIALNLLHRMCAVASETNKYSSLALDSGVKIFDTRKTTPGLRFLEKYAVKTGGGYNHRSSQTDVWMVKDNHKSFFGGLKGAVQFFQSQNQFYRPIICEIHSFEEFEEAVELGVQHLMLDNFSPEQIRKMVELKQQRNSSLTLEVSGGVNLNNLQDYLIPGLDGISIGGGLFFPAPVDISLKFN